MSVHFSSQSNEWATPQYFFDALNDEFHFTVDVAATADNAKCKRFYTYMENGLAKDWSDEVVWCNPPYGRQIGKWIDKALGSRATTVMLIPAKTETRWWAKFWDYDTQRPIDGCEVRFVFGRLQFGNSGVNAPFPCAVIIFNR